MSDTFEYIERFFTKSLTPEEQTAFEARCLSDKAFAEDVAFYVSARDQVKQMLHESKTAEFSELHKQLKGKNKNTGILRKMGPWIAAVAACLVLYFGYTMFFSKPSAQQMATNYTEKNFSTIGISMGGDGKDTLQQGIAAYNSKNFSEAEKIFQSLHNGAQHSEAVKYSGIVYLMTGRYNQAIAEFDLLSNDQTLYSNPGLFYKALTLLKRSGPGDETQARNLLNEVIRKELPGAKEAKEIMASLK